ncbi:uncharacterized protein K452DRAFT_233317 [Aplosporella prunicola CBS 121167]|uniref:Integral membrane protein n=1 Tax=Aplosporella prunicola CBS 121167 TaxID=1176127 RepID=A0A6A6B740_9PEZI|nr:uncharacterized protein K452DRAFT_233317 [Aplosporella prunicola CBS 121167]KAF2139054.1 hypothetical protein K452DRAFT_233317 [Aplosporella prunicola CBS 121167]
MPPVPENNNTTTTEAINFEPAPLPVPGRFRRASTAAQSVLGLQRRADRPTTAQTVPENEYDSRIVDLLDVLDPEISTLSSLTNVQNSLFIPDLGRLLNRQPTYALSRYQPNADDRKKAASATAVGETKDEPFITTATATATAPQDTSGQQEEDLRPAGERAFSISSDLSESRHAVLPHGVSLEGWSEADKAELDDHVRHMLHSRRSKFKRGLKGFGKYVSRPLGFFVTLYATLITLFGLAWVLFLIGWINVGGRQYYIINVIDNVLVALFAIMGDGLAPFRAVDTYHMIFIAHYHHLTWRLRKERELPKLQNKNDLPTQPATQEDVESARIEKEELSVLNPKQQARLVHHQTKFAKSHTFYKPHETETHFAFPLRLLVAIVVLLDFHSIFQIALGACTWGIDYKVRPQALTAVILCCSITVNITAGVIISIGDRITRKKDVIERMSRQELTEEAMRKIEKRHEKHEEQYGKAAEDGGATSQPRKSEAEGEPRAEGEQADVIKADNAH